MERPRRRCRRRGRAPAPGRGPAVVATTRPIPRHHRAASRARGVPAEPPAAALDPGPGGAGRRPRRPPGRPEPGRPATSPRPRVIPQESGSAAEFWREAGAVPDPGGPSPGGSSASPSLRGQVAVFPRVGPLVLVPPAGGEGDAGRGVPGPTLERNRAPIRPLVGLGWGRSALGGPWPVVEACYVGALRGGVR
jgi:hypothetical protein